MATINLMIKDEMLRTSHDGHREMVRLNYRGQILRDQK